MVKIALLSATTLIVSVSVILWGKVLKVQEISPPPPENIQIISPPPSPTPKIKLAQPPPSKTLNSDYHIFQTFNNCGPAALSMALSYFGITESQQKLGKDLRPYQNPRGDNDDKSVTLGELAEKAKEYDLIPYHRPVGSIELIRLFITHDIPVITRTLTKETEDIGHYRVIKGYDDGSGRLIQDDSLQGKNLTYSYEVFNKLWEKFNFEYLVLVPKDKQKIAEEILDENLDPKTAWTKAVKESLRQLKDHPDDIYSRFNLSVALYNTEDYQRSAEEFESVENKLPFRSLWYQIEPILAYQKLKNYDRVFELTGKILNNHNRAFSELYQIRGEVYLYQGKTDLAKAEFEKALFFNRNFKPAQQSLRALRT